MPTTTDLREVLYERAETTSTARPPIEAVLRQARLVRARRHVTVGAAALAVSAVVLVPTVVGWPNFDRAPAGTQTTAPSNGRVTSSSGYEWAPTVPGLDLEAGASLDLPYAFGSVVMIGSAEHDLGGIVRRLMDVPEGLLALVDTAPEPPGGPHPPTRVVLLYGDGADLNQKVIDTGYIHGFRASAPADGPTRLVWTWTDVGTDARPKEVRAIDLAVGGDPYSVTVDLLHSVRFIGGRDPVLGMGESVLSFARWEVETGVLVPVDERLGFVVDGSLDGEVLATFNEERQCTVVVRADAPETVMWERCDILVQGVSPDGTTALATLYADGRIDHTAEALAVLDLESGKDLGQLELPPSGGAEWGEPREPAVEWFVEAWEPDGSVILSIRYEGLPGEDPDTNFAPILHTTVRCVVKTGACELVPDPVEVVATRG